MKYDNRALFEALIKGPFSHFVDVGNEEFRDPVKTKSGNVSGYSISPRGVSLNGEKHPTETLFSLARDNDLLDSIEPSQGSEPSPRQPKEDNSEFVNGLWTKADHGPTLPPLVHSTLKTYLSQSRGIPESSWSDLAKHRCLRMSQHKGERMILYPTFGPETFAQALRRESYRVKRIQRIFLNPDCSKNKKMHLGSDSGCFVILPLNGNKNSIHALVVEGVEDGLSLRERFSDSWLIVATDKPSLKHVTQFIEPLKIEFCQIIADHDLPDEEKGVKPENTGQSEAWRLGESIKKTNVEVKCLMPPNPKDDANSALLMDRLDDWIESLIEIPKKYQIDNQGCRTAKPMNGYDTGTKTGTDKGEKEPDWPEPEEIHAELLPVQKLDPDLIPVPLKEWLIDDSHRMQCPLDYPASIAVVMTSIIIGTRCAIRPKQHDNWEVVPNLWGLICGNPSQLKTPAIQSVIKIIERLESKAYKKYEEDQKQYNRDYRTWEMKKKLLEDALRKTLKGGDSNDVQVAENDLANHEDNPPEQLRLRRYKTSDVTVPKLQEITSENPEGVMALRDELNGLLASMEQEGRESDKAFYLEGWGGQGSFTLDRIGRGTIRSELVCVSIFGTIQPSRLIPHIRQTVDGTGNDGFVPRFQVMVYPDADLWKYIDRKPNYEAERRAFDLIEKLAEMDFVNDAGATLEEGKTIPYLRFAPDAQTLFQEWITELETSLSNPDESQAMQEHLGKFRSLMPSLALIFHLLNVADGKTTGPISLIATKQACEWCDYLESHARRVYHMAEDLAIRAAGNLAEKLRQGKLADGFKAWEVRKKGWEMLNEKKVVQGALNELCEADWLRELRSTTKKISGRPSIKYLINPKIKNSNMPLPPTV